MGIGFAEGISNHPSGLSVLMYERFTCLHRPWG
jgi:hypothetical protein